MVASKGKVQSSINLVAEDSQCHKDDKDNEKIEVDVRSLKFIRESSVPGRRISVPHKRGSLLSAASDSKGAVKFGAKIKANQDVYIKRKPLADLSNRQIGFSGNVTSTGSKKPMIFVDPGCRTLNISSRKCSMGKQKTSQGVGSFHANRKGVKDLIDSSDNCGTNSRNPCHESTVNCSRSIKKNSLGVIRKSLPVSMTASQADSYVKNNEEGSEKAKSNKVVSGKANMSKNVAARVSTFRSYLQRNRASDGFIMTGARDQSNANARHWSRKSIKPIVKTAISVPNADRSSRSKCTLVAGKPISIAAISSRKKKEQILVVDSHEITQGCPSDSNKLTTKKLDPMVQRKSDRIAISVSNAARTSRSKCKSVAGKTISIPAISSRKKKELISQVDSRQAAKKCASDSSKLTTTKLDAIVQRKSDRRRSFTSSLMARSKLLVEYDEVVEKEEVPCIDNNCNQLEVAEYVEEIYQFYWVSELQMQSLSLSNYMSNQTEITPQMRGILINWLIEVHFRFELMPETLYLMVTLLDQYLCQVQIKKNEMQLVGLTALLLASKYEDFWHPRVKDLLSISAESYTRGQMLRLEKLILKKLKFRLNVPTPYVFMLRFMKAAQSDLKLEHLAFYLIELCLVEYEALKFKPSMLCASAIYVARSTLQIAPAWTPLLAKHARYEISQFRECAEMILRFQKAAKISHLKVTYEKYMSPDFSSVAALNPLDKLPL